MPQNATEVSNGKYADGKRVGHPPVGSAEVGGALKNASALINTPMKSGFSDKTKADAREKAGGKCEYCGKETVPGEKSQKGVTPPGNEGQTDHYTPASAGGSNDPANAMHSCRECNQEKSNTLPQGTKWDKQKPN